METIIKTSTRDDPFARVPKDLLNDPSISWRSKGVISYLIGKPKGWKMRVSDIQKHGTEGRDAIRAALNELRSAGYAELVRVREKGRTKEWVWKIADSKVFDPYVKKSPDPEKPDLVEPHLENQDHNKKECKNKKEGTKIDGTLTHSESAFEEEGMIEFDANKYIEEHSSQDGDDDGLWNVRNFTFQKPKSQDEDL
jgi:hypothetical protein